MSKVTSDGSTASYYELPEGAKELQHLISYRNMNGQLAEIFRACYRYGIVSHSDQLRDAKKMVFYAMAEVERLEKWAPLASGAADDAFDESRMDAIGQNGNDGLHYAEDMTDPRNWRAGDWIEAVSSSGNGYEAGELYMVKSVKGNSVSTVLDRKGSKENGWLTKWFRFHARPDADGWIEWRGGERPVGRAVVVEYIMRADRGEFRGTSEKAGGLRWKHDGSGGDIIAYRPHLATKQDKG
ncbi:MAG: hypothetical protein Tp138OMZ00d2C19078221_52 [Prokaryotic dsDNA virus sp.]|jgi:hypothetical protein|nr:hypothetical protein [Pseudomonadales bacterium]QDP67480.1 MAG: hypothetical protein Tp138OMZ00d2C19078221_52 [Prokaryotic dsDNA virus sp.]|tara:strand:- start:24343 stop:25062 length:720 start_codon:yes stop_codon:yes gene_type:complete